MIPKVIHYCWFGPNPLSELAIKCIDSWKKYLPDYEIKLWNEANFDLDMFLFTREAYDSKKYAYVTDVVRLYALATDGGIYMDTDVEVLKSLDVFLHHTAFSGFESDSSLPTGIMGSEKNGKWSSDMLQYYTGKKFLDKRGQPILKTNVVIISELMAKKGVEFNNTYQNIDDYISFYPSDFFCPKHPATGKLILTSNTHCIHHFAGSWAEPPSFSILVKSCILKLLYLLVEKKSLDKILRK